MEWYPLKGDGRTLFGEPFFGSGQLDAELAATPGVLWRMENGRRCLALPYAENTPFPLVELFCFARVCQVCGKQYVVYFFDKKACPML